MTGLEISLLSLTGALFPLALVLTCMVLLRWSGARAGAAGAVAAAILGYARFGADLSTLGVATWKGALLSFHVLYIIWPSLLLYYLVHASGAIRSIAVSVSSLTQDHILQLLILGFAFSSFLQGVAGFGVPVAVVAPLLIGLGFPPIQAAAVPLIGHSWAVTMGDLASSFQALLAVTELPARPVGLWSALFLGFACVLTGFAIAHVHAGLLPIRRCFGSIVMLCLSMALTQLALSYFGHWILASFCAGMVGLAVSLVLARLSQKDYPSLLGLFPAWPAPWGSGTPHREIAPPVIERPMGFNWAFSAYYVLIVVVTAFTLVPILHDAANFFTVTFYFPPTATRLGWITEASSYTLNVFGHPGAYLCYTILFAWLIYRRTGHLQEGAFVAALKSVWKSGVPTTFGILFMVIMAMIMTYSGIIFVLARGAIALAGPSYPLFSPFVGLLGCFMTGSNTNSNVLFGVLQRDIAILLDKDPYILAALQTTGGALGSMIAPAKVLVGCATAGLSGREGEVLSVTIKYCLLMVALISVLGSVVLTLSEK
jgi:lactate permease